MNNSPWTIPPPTTPAKSFHNLELIALAWLIPERNRSAPSLINWLVDLIIFVGGFGEFSAVKKSLISPTPTLSRSVVVDELLSVNKTLPAGLLRSNIAVSGQNLTDNASNLEEYSLSNFDCNVKNYFNKEEKISK